MKISEYDGPIVVKYDDGSGYDKPIPHLTDSWPEYGPMWTPVVIGGETWVLVYVEDYHRFLRPTTQGWVDGDGNRMTILSKPIAPSGEELTP